jgi:probable O-glycosylation ligase (exosortase A-associated)
VGKLLLLFIIFCCSVAALSRPWIGVSSYYLLAILGPQYIWWWNFQGLRVSFIVAVVTLLSVSIKFLGNNYNSSFLFNKQNFWIFFLWTFLVLSYFFGPYVASFSSSGMGPSQIMSVTNTIFLFYFFSSLEINEIKKIRYLIIVFILSTIYLIYWANDQYFSQNWWQFSMGRLMGPASIDGGAIYRDENTFAMLFVTGLPFIYYLAHETKKWWLRYGLWLMVPLGWHAIFLTGSRGGLVGLGAALLCICFFSKRKLLVLPLLILFLLFYQWQAGDVMSNRSQQIVEYEGEGSAEQRIAAWTGGMRMIADKPVFGVGLGSFVTALPDYYDTSPRVAHNTLIQYAAESGVAAGVAYLAIVIIFFSQSRRIFDYCRGRASEDRFQSISLYNKANTTSFVGLFICSLFLSLNTYEIFFVLLLINNSLYRICFDYLPQESFHEKTS